MTPSPPDSTLFPYTTLFRSWFSNKGEIKSTRIRELIPLQINGDNYYLAILLVDFAQSEPEEYLLRSEEHTSELQSPCNLVCRLLLEKKKNNKYSRETSRIAS